MASINERYAVITGATSGIGYELAKLFAKDGYKLVIVARNQTELDSKASEFYSQYQTEVVTIAKDLSINNSGFDLYDEIKAKGIQVDVLVNNAAQGQYGQFVETDIQRELEMVQLNIVTYLVLTKLFLKEMVARNSGKILQVASIGGKLPGPLTSVYHATKAFIVSHTDALVNELKDTGVTITALLPGPTDTDFFRKAGMENTTMVQEGSLSDPAKVAKDGYEALMSGDASVISGLKNKIQVGMADILPDNVAAKMVEKQMEPSDKGQ
ncbi:MAG: estradiol 17-beta-dehydrogenase [Segetibacter sp.]|nr:estradiol 17-beta-dehydrogenase [Segetibacter sp.]